MDKEIVLCWECRKLLQEHYDVTVNTYSSPGSPKCENCGRKYGLSLCRVKNKEDDR